MSAEPARRHTSGDALAAELEAYRQRPYRIAAVAGLVVSAAIAALCWRQSSRPPPKPPIVIAAAAQPLRIESFEVALHRRNPPESLGPIGVSAFEARYEDDVRVHARLSAPGYSYLIALNPDGSVDLCLPGTPMSSPRGQPQ